MLIAEKLERLIGDDSRTSVALTVGVPVYRLSNHLEGRTRPTVAVSIRLARLFGVDPLWLIDDEQSWPPVQLSSAFAHVDASDADDVTRARQALHRCVDLLDAERLLRVVSLVGKIVDEQLVEHSDSSGSECGRDAHPDAASGIRPAAGEKPRRRACEVSLATDPRATPASEPASRVGDVTTLAEVGL